MRESSLLGVAFFLILWMGVLFPFLLLGGAVFPPLPCCVLLSWVVVLSSLSDFGGAVFFCPLRVGWPFPCV